MNSGNRTKINQLLHLTPPGVVMASNWLSRQGYSSELIRSYKNSRWLASFGNGAVTRYMDEVDYLGAVYALQHQLQSTIHPAAKTALSLLGRSHYLELNQHAVYLFGKEREALPTWFKRHDWGHEVLFFTSSFLPPGIGMTTFNHKNFSIMISGHTRAIMECLYLTPGKMNLLESYELMEGLHNPRPGQVQELLENCNSVKVKRLFLYLAEKSNHGWLKYLNIENIDLGSGKRSFAQQGVYNAKYQITVPKEIEDNESPGV